MNSPKWILCITALLLAAGVKAQDKIHKTDGEIINAKVKTVGTSTVTYVRFENQDGPEYTVDKSDVSEIIYENGSKDVFENSGRRYPHPPHPPMPPDPFSRFKNANIKYAPNVLAIAPFQCTDNGIGTSITYERTIDKTGYLSFYLPAIATYNITGQYNNGNSKPNSMYYIMPGIKFYPTTNQGRAKFAFGPSLVLGTGKVYDFSSFAPPGSTRKEVGMMFNSSINTSPTPHFFIGTELGMGGTYVNKVNGIEQGARFLIQFGFRMGYRF